VWRLWQCLGDINWKCTIQHHPKIYLEEWDLHSVRIFELWNWTLLSGYDNWYTVIVTEESVCVCLTVGTLTEFSYVKYFTSGKFMSVIYWYTIYVSNFNSVLFIFVGWILYKAYVKILDKGSQWLSEIYKWICLF